MDHPSAAVQIETKSIFGQHDLNIVWKQWNHQVVTVRTPVERGLVIAGGHALEYIIQRHLYRVWAQGGKDTVFRTRPLRATISVDSRWTWNVGNPRRFLDVGSSRQGLRLERQESRYRCTGTKSLTDRPNLRGLSRTDRLVKRGGEIRPGEPIAACFEISKGCT